MAHKICATGTPWFKGVAGRTNLDSKRSHQFGRILELRSVDSKNSRLARSKMVRDELPKAVPSINTFGACHPMWPDQHGFALQNMSAERQNPKLKPRKTGASSRWKALFACLAQYAFCEPTEVLK